MEAERHGQQRDETQELTGGKNIQLIFTRRHLHVRHFQSESTMFLVEQRIKCGRTRTPLRLEFTLFFQFRCPNPLNVEF